jgi:hypothetical protein
VEGQKNKNDTSNCREELRQALMPLLDTGNPTAGFSFVGPNQLYCAPLHCQNQVCSDSPSNGLFTRPQHAHRPESNRLAQPAFHFDVGAQPASIVVIKAVWLSTWFSLNRIISFDCESYLPRATNCDMIVYDDPSPPAVPAHQKTVPGHHRPVPSRRFLRDLRRRRESCLVGLLLAGRRAG